MRSREVIVSNHPGVNRHRKSLIQQQDLSCAIGDQHSFGGRLDHGLQQCNGMFITREERHIMRPHNWLSGIRLGMRTTRYLLSCTKQ